MYRPLRTVVSISFGVYLIGRPIILVNSAPWPLDRILRGVNKRIFVCEEEVEEFVGDGDPLGKGSSFVVFEGFGGLLEDGCDFLWSMTFPFQDDASIDGRYRLDHRG